MPYTGPCDAGDVDVVLRTSYMISLPLSSLNSSPDNTLTVPIYEVMSLAVVSGVEGVIR
jgi:hypothetical protein